MLCVTHRRRDFYFFKSAGYQAPSRVSSLRDVQGAALLEFAISLPLLVVFVVGIDDFSGCLYPEAEDRAGGTGRRYSRRGSANERHSVEQLEPGLSEGSGSGSFQHVGW